MVIPRDHTLPPLPARPDDSHKGTYGHVLALAGSRGMSGAAALVGLGALRGGAGLVTLAVPASIQSAVAAIEPSYLTVGLPDDDAGRLSRNAARTILQLVERATAVAMGSGWGQSADLRELSHLLYTTLAAPLVIDADGLNALAATPGGFPSAPEGAVRIVTPHPGEFARMVGSTTAVVQQDREELAAGFARAHRVIVVLKGHGTVISDGHKQALNTTGNSGMATGGSGDVLTGLVAALLAQDMNPFDAAHLGAHLHGLAGDLAANQIGKPALIASDIPRFLGMAWKQLGAD